MGKTVDFQVWIRALLSDATLRNKAHIVARLTPGTLRRFYERGVPPTVEGIAKRSSEPATEQAKAKAKCA